LNRSIILTLLGIYGNIIPAWFLDIADSQAALKKKRVKGISSPWITPELKWLMFQRDKLKKLATRFPTDGNWTSHKHMKNNVDYEIKNAKMN